MYDLRVSPTVAAIPLTLPGRLRLLSSIYEAAPTTCLNQLPITYYLPHTGYRTCVFLPWLPTSLFRCFCAVSPINPLPKKTTSSTSHDLPVSLPDTHSTARRQAVVSFLSLCRCRRRGGCGSESALLSPQSCPLSIRRWTFLHFRTRILPTV